MRLDEFPAFWRAYSTHEFYVNVRRSGWVGNPVPTWAKGEVCFWDFLTDKHGSLFFFKEAQHRQGPGGIDLVTLDSRIPVMFKEVRTALGEVDVGVLDVHRLPLDAQETYVWEVLKGSVYQLVGCGGVDGLS